MKAKQIRFSDVFDGTANYGPEAVISADLAKVVQILHLHVETSEDGLDRFEVVPMEIRNWRFAQPIRFALWRHAGNPPGTFAIHMAVDGPRNKEALRVILDDLNIQQTSVIWEPAANAA